jgi:SAM-dependent methyltransferase
MTNSSLAIDLTAVKQAQREVWSAGDYAVVGAGVYPTAEVLCDDVAFSAGQRVLDVACGSGNVALAAARRHAEVVGIDYVPTLLDRARQRAAAEGLDIVFDEADAEALPFPDASFDVVLSAFGVMFAPNQERAAAELARVCRPGGKIGLAVWPPVGGVAEMFDLAARFAPAPAGLRTPVEWGTAGRLRELFGSCVASIRLHDRVWVWRHRTAADFVATYRAWFGPVRQTFAALDDAQAAAYAAGLTDIAERYNRAVDGTIAAAFAYLTVAIDR